MGNLCAVLFLFSAPTAAHEDNMIAKNDEDDQEYDPATLMPATPPVDRRAAASSVRWRHGSVGRGGNGAHQILGRQRKAIAPPVAFRLSYLPLEAMPKSAWAASAAGQYVSLAWLSMVVQGL
ncbi:uncharacterized protein BCR38DRAFT_414409 [Pseudomassariella vexata]|uniref:Uncharacterized protein n=1 Tax=Pseudomassariella vexata TaxID=1141098 RepID=A0A1Y2DBL7_9PEZI|nr:uncharacterized protein BCR38DRAFT_414409 [Pseudomassariella vexata]ORY56658.1 hypothetical protein BCR38DRAFT_414409 [Pseudomassariella vexata]